jgi:hypothetical protein
VYLSVPEAVSTEVKWQSKKITHSHIKTREEMVEPYVHFPAYLYDILLT